MESCMRIILNGVGCVGKSTVGKLLAEKLGYTFVDFDFAVEDFYQSHITFIKQNFYNEYGYRRQVREVLLKILEENPDNLVLAMPPSGLMDYYWKIIKKDDSLMTVVIRDSARNILERLTFYDDYTVQMESQVTPENAHRYLEEIRLDMEYFGRSYTRAKMQVKANGKSALQVADEIHRMLFPQTEDTAVSI